MNVNRRKNIQGLIRNITYFTDSTNKVLNSKIILQYFINQKICKDKEELQYTAPRHGNANADTPFFPLKKTSLDKFKNQVSGKGKRAVSIVMTMQRNLKMKNDYDLSRSTFADNEVGDILAFDEELGDNSIFWHHSDIPEDLWV